MLDPLFEYGSIGEFHQKSKQFTNVSQITIAVPRITKHSRNTKNSRSTFGNDFKKRGQVIHESFVFSWWILRVFCEHFIYFVNSSLVGFVNFVNCHFCVVRAFFPTKHLATSSNEFPLWVHRFWEICLELAKKLLYERSNPWFVLSYKAIFANYQ